MKKSLIGSVDLKPQLKCEQEVVVEYFRTEAEECKNKKVFGIEVVKKQLIDGIVYREIKTVNKISDDTEVIDRVLKTLCKNSVTPVSVGDVLEDMKII